MLSNNIQSLSNKWNNMILWWGAVPSSSIFTALALRHVAPCCTMLLATLRKVAYGLIWVALDGSGWLWLAQVCFEWLWLALGDSAVQQYRRETAVQLFKQKWPNDKNGISCSDMSRAIWTIAIVVFAVMIQTNVNAFAWAKCKSFYCVIEQLICARKKTEYPERYQQLWIIEDLWYFLEDYNCKLLNWIFKAELSYLKRFWG